MKDLAKIEYKQSRAEENRNHMLEHRMQEYRSKPELSNLLQKKQEREQKFMDEIFSKVTVKRHEKEQKMKKMEKNIKF